MGAPYRLHPSNPFILTKIYILIFAPIKISFIDDNSYPIWDWFDNVVDGIFMLDIVFNFFLAYYDTNIESWVVTWCKIAKRYIMFWFWVDLITVLPLDLIYNEAQTLVLLRLSKLPKLYRIFKITRLSRGFKNVKSQASIWGYILYMMRVNPGLMRVLTNVFSICIFCHVFACLWNFVPQLSDHDDDSWIIKLGMQDASGIDRYLTSLYWITQTVITVGYGDVPIRTVSERVMAIIAMFAGVIFFSLTVGTLTSLLADLDKRNSEFENKISMLGQIREQFGISDDLFLKLRIAIKYGVYKADEDYESLLKVLPEKLSTELGMIIYGPKVKDLNLFKEKPPELICAVGPYLNHVTFAKDDYIYMKGDYSNEMYFLEDGVVSLVIPELNDLQCMTVAKGNFFGEYELIHSCPRNFTFKAITQVQLWTMEKKYFAKIFFRDFRKVGSWLKGVSDNRMRDAEVALYHIDSIISKKNEEQHEHFASLSEILEKMNYTPSDSQEGTAMNSIGQRRSNISQRSRLLSVFTETMQDAGDTLQKSMITSDYRMRLVEDLVKDLEKRLGMHNETEPGSPLEAPSKSLSSYSSAR
jgi:hypothetical protein